MRTPRLLPFGPAWLPGALPFVLALLARALPLAFGMEHYGDAPVRIELAERWARAPHLWRGFAEAYQYGPLHLTLLGWALRVLPDRFVAPRLLSLACGLLSLWLLGRIATRAAGPRAALFATCALALSPLHIQASTTGASEAVFLALLLGCLESFFEGGLALPAILLGAAGLVRYDGWLYVPLLCALFLRERGPLRTALFAGLASLPAALWLLVNWRSTGDALAPLRYINRDHRILAQMALGYFGQVHYRLYALFYWPIAVLGIATPVAGALATWGALRTLWRQLRGRPAPDGWQLAALAWAPAAYLTFRAAVLADFRPLARFGLVAATLSLPFAWDALELLRPRARRIAFALAAAGMVATPLCLALASWNRDGTLAEWARPLSPISSVPPGIAQAARWLRENARAGDHILLDGVWDYLDIPLAFAVDRPDESWARKSWTDDFDARLARTPPTLAVLLYQGELRNDPRAVNATEEAERFSFDGREFCRARKFVYASVYRRCAR